MAQLLHEDRWSWADLACTLNEAGIIYSTGRPWSAALLTMKASKLRTHRRRAVTEITPRDLAAAIHEALSGAAGGFANITINLPAAAPPGREHAAGPLRRSSEAPARPKSVLPTALNEPLPYESPRQAFGLATLRDHAPSRPAPPTPVKPFGPPGESDEESERLVDQMIAADLGEGALRAIQKLRDEEP